MDKKLISTAEAAKILGISRIAIFKKIKSGEIKAQKVGRNYVIEQGELPEILGTVLSERNKTGIEKAVDKAIKDYGETLKLLGEE